MANGFSLDGAVV